MKTTDIHQTVTFKKVTPHQVYDALMNSRKHAAFTGDDAQIGTEVGDKGTAFSGWAEFTNEELIPDKKIIQKWRASDWPEEAFSTVTFEFEPDGVDTKLTFTQTDVPEEFAKDIAKGWQTEYWQKMQAYFAENS